MALSCLLLATSSTVAAEDSRAAPAFQVAPCHFIGVKANWATQNRVECGWLQVPESRGKSDSRILKLWVAIARADARTKLPDPILYIHGGPGIGTTDYFFPAFPKSQTWPGFRKNRDIIYFDQRGTGRSSAACPELTTQMEALTRQALPARDDLNAQKNLFRACHAKLETEGFDFGAYNSIATVEDAEDLRTALGVAKWNLYGVSYGTLVGLQYLRAHPDSLRAAILDSVFPPNSANGAEQIGTTAKAYEALQRACNMDAACAKQFPSIVARQLVAVSRLDAQPLKRDDRMINGAAFAAALWSMLAESYSAPWVPAVIERAAAGDDELVATVVKIYGGSSSFGDFNVAQAVTVNCFEVQTGKTTEQRRETMRRYPQLVGSDSIPESVDEICDAWQAVRAPVSHAAPVHSSVAVLLYGGEFDPATPYDDALLASRFLPNSTLVFVRGASHASFYQDDCTRGVAHFFLSNPAVSPDLACLEKRPKVSIPVSGVDEFLKSLQ